MSWRRWTTVAIALVSLGGCMEDAWAQHANPDPHAGPRTAGPSVLDALHRRSDAGFPSRAADASDTVSGSLGDTIGDRFGWQGLGSSGGYDRARDGGVAVPAGQGTIGIGRLAPRGDGGTFGAGAMGVRPSGHGRFEALTVEGPVPTWEVQAALSRVAARTNNCLVTARQTGNLDIMVRLEFGAPPTAPSAIYDTTNAVVRQCMTEALARALVSASTPVTRVTARFRRESPPDAGRP